VKGPRRKLLGTVVVGVSLVAAACGSSSNTTTASPTTGGGATTSGVTITVPPSSAAGSSSAITDKAKLPANMDDWEKLWATQRAAIVQRIKDNKWGVSADGNTLTGPEGFTVDLSKCSAGWSATEGLTDTEIKLGQTLAQSGTLAYAANYGKGQEAIFNYYSAKGAFTDINGKNRKISYTQKDDGYDPAKTIPLVDELIDSDKVFGMTTLGSPNTLKTYDKLNQRCIPQLFNQTGHPAWGDPAKRACGASSSSST
jgi:hypothetical protein